MTTQFVRITFVILSLASASLLAALVDGAPGRDTIIRNPDFQNGLEGWGKEDSTGKLKASVEERNGYKALKMVVDAPAAKGWPMFVQPLNLSPGKTYAISLEMDAENTGGGAGPYYCIAYFDASGKRTDIATGAPLIQEGAWTASRLGTLVPATAVTMKLQLILHGHGTAWWRNIRVTEIDKIADTKLAARVTAILAPKPNPRPLLGIGFEDDGYAYSARNLGYGITPEELRLREERIRYLQADHVRMFVPLGEWLPAGFFRTTPEPEKFWKSGRLGDAWHSRIRTLEQYQAMGTAVNITGQEFGGINYLGPLWQDAGKISRLYADLLEYLVKEKGFSCIKYFTLNNEPDASFAANGGTFETYETIHALLRQELMRRKLDVTLIGSDDASSYHFFSACITSDAVRDSADIFSSHLYPGDYELNRMEVDRLVNARMDLIARKAPRKDLIIGEFGFSAPGAGQGAPSNPLMQTYNYALYSTDLILCGLARGVSGFSLWILHQVYYPTAACEPVMGYGMWGYRTAPGDVYPVFHALANLTRHTNPGDIVTPVSVDGDRVRACRVGDYIFWVNLRDTPVTFCVEGVPLLENCTYTQSTLSGEGECGKSEAIRENTCELLPRSFGRIRMDVVKGSL